MQRFNHILSQSMLLICLECYKGGAPGWPSQVNVLLQLRSWVSGLYKRRALPSLPHLNLIMSPNSISTYHQAHMNVGQGNTISQSTPYNFTTQIPHHVPLSLLSVGSSPSGLYRILKCKGVCSALAHLHVFLFPEICPLPMLVWSLLFILFSTQTASYGSLADTSLPQPLSHHTLSASLQHSSTSKTSSFVR